MNNTEEMIQQRRDAISAKMAQKRERNERTWVDGNLTTTIVQLSELNLETPSESIDVIIPFYGCIEERQQNLKCTITYINNISPNYNIIVVEQGEQSSDFISTLPVTYITVPIDDTLFHKTKILNHAMTLTSSDIVVMLDADMIIHPDLVANFSACASRGYLTMPFYDICYTTKSQKSLTLNNNNYMFSTNDEVMNIPTRKDVGGCNVFFRDDYIAVGKWDECFVGWGAEDTAFATKFQTMLNGVRHINVLGIHLHHETSNNNPKYSANIKNLNVIANSSAKYTQTNTELSPIWFPSYFGENADLNHYAIKSFESVITNNTNRDIIIMTNKPWLFPDDSRITKIEPFGLDEFKSQSHGASITHWIKSWMPSKYLIGSDSFFHIDNDTYWIKDPAPITHSRYIATLWDYGNLNKTTDIEYSNVIAGRTVKCMEYKWLSSGSGQLPVLSMNDVIDSCLLSVNNRPLLKTTQHRNDGDEVAYYRHYTQNPHLWETNFGYCNTHKMGEAGIHFGGDSKQESMDIFLKNKK